MRNAHMDTCHIYKFAAKLCRYNNNNNNNIIIIIIIIINPFSASD